MSHVFAFDHPHGLPLPALKALIGGKAANITTMVTELGLPVPPGFTVSTAACKAYLAGGWPDGLDAELRAAMAGIEAAVGRRFGDPADPLLVSVRSGAPVSMPGMMDTILNLGLNAETAAGLAAAAGDPAFAHGCLERFETMFRSIVGVAEVPADPWLQLRAAVEAVFRSWNGERARTYRRVEGIPDDLGTGVTVQAMVFGNRGADSGTGVLFTRNPATGAPVLYGDILFNAQGEDVVAGTHWTEPIAVLDERFPALGAELRRYADLLEHHYADLCDIEFTIERGRLWLLQVRVGKRSPQAALRIARDMAEEESFPLTRAQAVERVAALLANPPTVADEPAADARPGAGVDARRELTCGLPASPGLASGEIVTTPEAAIALADAGRSAILVRSGTSPDDVHGMARAAGILTASGGLASHAAVVARGWGIPAVVGAVAVRVGADAITIDGRRLAVGTVISIDGATGQVFEGALGGARRVVPEAATLLAWAAELGIAIGEGRDAASPAGPGAESSAADGPEPAGAASASPVGAASASPAGGGSAAAAGGPGDRVSAAPSTPAGVSLREAVIRALAIKGFALADALAPCVGAPAEQVRPVLDALVADGLAEPSSGSVRLAPAGREAAGGLLAADRDAWGAANALAALDAFLALDHRMKETVTAWQMREVNSRQTFNDHADAAYDACVLASLGDLHLDATAWLRPCIASLPRLATYLERLDRAAAAVAAGDGKYIASPRVDSYHGVWFELHEDLIGLAGRSRADEVAAGRA